MNEKYIKTFENFESVSNESKTEKPEPKFKKGDIVKYLPKISGLSPDKTFEIEKCTFKTEDELSKAFGIEFKPTYVYCLKNVDLCAIEDDLKLVK